MRLSLSLIEIIPFVVVVALLFVQGVWGWRGLQAQLEAHWTHDDELFHWRQGPPDFRLADRTSFLYAVYCQLIPYVFLLPLILFVLDRAEGTWFLWPCIAVALPARHAGVMLAQLLFIRSRSRSVTVTNTGIIIASMFLPWEAISHFEHDTRERTIRLYAKRTPQALLAMLQPPDDLGEQVLGVLRQHMSAHLPQASGAWYRRAGGGEGRCAALFLLGVVLATAAYALHNRTLACILLAIGFWVWLKLSVRIVEHMLGVRLANAEQGLSQRDLPSPAAAVRERIIPAGIQLRPLSLGDLLDATFRLYRQHFAIFVGIAALLYVPVAVLRFVALLAFGDDAASWLFMSALSPLPIALAVNNGWGLGWIGVSALVYLIAQTLIVGALTNAVARFYLGRPTSIVDAYRLGGGRIAVLLLASIVPLWLDGLVGISRQAFELDLVWRPLFTSPGELARIVAALSIMLPALLPFLAVWFVGMHLLLVPQAVVIEGCRPVLSLIRSWRLVSGSIWRVFVVTASAMLIVYLLTTLPAATLGVALRFAGVDRSALLLISGLVAGQIGLIMAQPIQICAYTLLYYDLRLRKEGFDLALSASEQPPASSSPSVHDREGRPSTTDR